MSQFLTALEARELSGPTLDERIAALCDSIRTVAATGRRDLRCGYDHKADDGLWINGGYNQTPEWRQAKAKLEALGYTVEFYYADGSFAVDMYTLIKW